MVQGTAHRRLPGLLCRLALALTLPPADAVIFYSTADLDYNTTTPLIHSGATEWDLQGIWGNFLGTPIAPQYFLTARHVGGGIGDSFVVNGALYLTTAFFDNAGSDLRIWQVDHPFPSFASLYTGLSESGQPLLVFGRGTQRGEPVSVPGPSGSEIKGWRWGLADGRKRWGENQVDRIVDGDALVAREAAPSFGVGELLRVYFDSASGPNEAHLSGGDSGGGVFIQEGLSWKLAGINYAVDGSYSLTGDDAGFSAAVFDESGLFVGEAGDWVQRAPGPTPLPGAFYATRVSTHASWIYQVTSGNFPPAPRLFAATDPNGPYVEEQPRLLDVAGQTIALGLNGTTRFYRLSGPAAFTIQSITSAGNTLILKYQ